MNKTLIAVLVTLLVVLAACEDTSNCRCSPSPKCYDVTDSRGDVSCVPVAFPTWTPRIHK